ncbi:hypothetical protein F1654_13600 [Alkalicaulis satelles]|uniref:Lipoprotein n=1 Tax=Alkalicaulis satelles TaxID=2609175 RepID=A0A5M6Z8U7_9PROT|nr:hypothetical protein [Alkalicaulis satelles]KAA5801082.1 hypothetical protein F1654_13600 [Alkalicaulis satelles]
MKYAVLMAGACALALTACNGAPDSDPVEDEAAGLAEQAEEAIEGADEALDDAVSDVADAADDAVDELTGPAGLIEGLSALCGQSFAGSITSPDDPRDEAFAGRDLVMHVRECFEDEVRVPFHVGDDHSRTWLITRLDDGRLRLKHDHRKEDGSEDVLTQYGGETVMPPAGARADFVVDTFSQELFVREGIPESATNIWIMELTETAFYYRLTRENRFFEVTFDLTEEVDTPPTPWGWEDE